MLSALPGTPFSPPAQRTEGLQARVPGAPTASGPGQETTHQAPCRSQRVDLPAAEHPPAGTPSSALTAAEADADPGRATASTHAPQKVNVRQSAVTGDGVLLPSKNSQFKELHEIHYPEIYISEETDLSKHPSFQNTLNKHQGQVTK